MLMTSRAILFRPMLAAVAFIPHVVGDCFMCPYTPVKTMKKTAIIHKPREMSKKEIRPLAIPVPWLNIR